MILTNDEQWMLSYLQQRVQSWNDVRDGAARAMKRIRAHEDFIDWSEYFLPEGRREELRKALTAYKIERVKAKGSAGHIAEPTHSIKLSDRAIKLLLAQAKKQGVSPSECIENWLS